MELALAYRLCDWLGLTDLIHTHMSVRAPGEQDHLLQLPYGHLFGEARASQMVKCDVDGNIVSDPTGLGISRGGFCIPSAIHMAKPRALCVMHAHSEATIAVANYRDGLLPLSQHALRFCGRIASFDYCGVFDSYEKRTSLPDALGDGDVLMLRNHGPLVIGETVAQCFSRIYYLERACRMQVASLSICRDPKTELVWPDEADCRFMSRAFEGGEEVIAREWAALRRMLTGRWRTTRADPLQLRLDAAFDALQGGHGVQRLRQARVGDGLQHDLLQLVVGEAEVVGVLEVQRHARRADGDQDRQADQLAVAQA